MDSEEIACHVIGYRKRINEYSKVTRHNTWLLLLPHIKKNSIKSPKELYLLPGEDEHDEKKIMTKEEKQEIWERINKIHDDLNN